MGHAVHHLVVLGDDVGEEVFLLVLVARLHVGGKGVVGQTTGFTHLLEHDGVHATTVVFVEQSLHSSLFRIPLALLVVDHAHVDVLGVVRSDDDFVLRRRQHLVVLAFGHGL